MHLPDQFRQNVAGASPNGVAWLELLPSLLAEFQNRWRVTLAPPFALSFNYVAPAVTADGRAVVVKLGVPNPELTSEIQALRLYSGETPVRLLDFDEEKGALLLERLLPGHPLRSIVDDEQATRIAAQTMRKLWKPLPMDSCFVTVGQWASGVKRLRARFGGATGPFPRRLVDIAESLFAELLASAGSPVLLHGDLHHENILFGRDRWIAIDPKGVAGEPEYEVGPFLENPTVELCTDAAIQRRRLDILSEELGLDRERMLSYAVARAVLSAWWSYEDSGSGWESACACAETLASLRPR
jgi:streptomycin 6-kinase